MHRGEADAHRHRVERVVGAGAIRALGVEEIDVGLPDERRLSKACGRAERVYVYAYGGRAASVWWEQNAGKLARAERLTVRLLSDDDLATLGRLAQRNMRLQCTIQDGSVWLSDGQHSVPVTPETLLAPRADH